MAATSLPPTDLAELLRGLDLQEGIHPSRVPGVNLMHTRRSFPRVPLVYEPYAADMAARVPSGFVDLDKITAGGFQRGLKFGHLGDERYCYDRDNYLVLSVPLPFECETRATPEAPLLGLSVTLQPALIQELLLQLDEPGPGAREVPRGICSAPITEALRDASCRLLHCLRSDTDSRVLGPQLVREIVFRVLQGPYGGALRNLAARQGHFGTMARVLQRIHADYAEALDIETLAREAHMSVSSFHHNFKAVTSSSPLQYLKSIRLHKARMLMANDGERASAAALRVGYESVSQFNREFKRAFGNSPGEELRQLRAGPT